MRHDWAYKRVRRQPPGCLAGLAVRTNSDATQAVRGYLGGNGSLFELVSPSGQTPVLLGRYLDKPWPKGYDEYFQGRILVSPLAIRWEPSGEVVELFDGSRHGYNPQHEIGSVHRVGETERGEYVWPGEPLRDPVFVACFSHTFDDDVDLSDEETARPEDFFDWFTLMAWSPANGEVRGITDFECA